VPRVLLTSVTRPLGPRHGDAPSVGYDAVGRQFTVGQGVLSPTAPEPHYGIELAAANLDAPTTTLQYPSRREFVHELRRGEFTHVGISFNATTAHRMREMCADVRRHAPRAVIALGGYGAALPRDVLLRYGDVVCRGEGAAFLRDLLGEPARRPPLVHPLLVSCTRLLGRTMSRSGMVFGGLGCPRGCDFCCTSHQYRQAYHPILPSAGDLLRVVAGYRAIDPGLGLRVLDEDFLLNRPRALAFAERVQERGWHLSIFAFASVAALSEYTMRELVALGLGGVFIGFEGGRAPYAKRLGRPLSELFADLRRHGIWVQTSMMIGMEHQDRDTVVQDLEELLALAPAAPLYSIHTPLPGTPLHDRVEREGRWLPQYREDRWLRWRHSDAFLPLFEHPRLAPEQILALRDRCYREDFRRLGPTVLRIARVWAEGLRHLEGSRDPVLARRADHLRAALRRTEPLLPLMWLRAPSGPVRRRVEELATEVRRLRSRPRGLPARALGLAVLPLAASHAVRQRLELDREPGLQRRDWSGPARPASR